MKIINMIRQFFSVHLTPDEVIHVTLVQIIGM